MELKKSKRADLERDRGAFLQIGLVVVLSLVLLAFNYKTNVDKSNHDKFISETTFEPEIIQSTVREEPKPQKIEPKLVDILNIVPNDLVIEEDFDFNVEANSGTVFEFKGFFDEEEETEETVIFFPGEDMPTFNGGDPTIEFRKYIAQNLKYPAIAEENDISGRVFVQFAINSKGKLVDAKVVRSIDPALDKEALRVINSSPLWTPGSQRGKPVKVLYTFPITFILY